MDLPLIVSMWRNGIAHQKISSRRLGSGGKDKVVWGSSRESSASHENSFSTRDLLSRGGGRLRFVSTMRCDGARAMTSTAASRSTMIDVERVN